MEPTTKTDAQRNSCPACGAAESVVVFASGATLVQVDGKWQQVNGIFPAMHVCYICRTVYVPEAALGELQNRIGHWLNARSAKVLTLPQRPGVVDPFGRPMKGN